MNLLVTKILPIFFYTWCKLFWVNVNPHKKPKSVFCILSRLELVVLCT